MSLSPIALFVYNRPWHTQQTLDALANNELAIDSVLYIYCDGAMNDSTEHNSNQINQTRSLVKNEKRFKKVIITEQIKNKGLANSIIDGVTQIVNKHGTVIVVEDDIVTSPGFLKYMNDALRIYKNTENVMHISGYMYPVKKTLPETFFIKPATCWGWATWKRAWIHFEKNVEKQMQLIEEKNGWKEFTIDHSWESYKDQLELNRLGKINTWMIFWYASIFLKGGTSLHPYPSLVQNIGCDGTGVHFNEKTDSVSPYHWPELAKNIHVSEKSNFNNPKAYRRLKRYYKDLYYQLKKFNSRDKFYLFRKNLLSNFKKWAFQ